jgi:hypothetical protein
VADGESNLVGKRYHCEVCGVGIICAKQGAGRFVCHAQPMTMDSAKPLPSTD